MVLELARENFDRKSTHPDRSLGTPRGSPNQKCSSLYPSCRAFAAAPAKNRR
jgi:hypothetical protein